MAGEGLVCRSCTRLNNALHVSDMLKIPSEPNGTFGELIYIYHIQVSWIFFVSFYVPVHVFSTNMYLFYFLSIFFFESKKWGKEKKRDRCISNGH